MTLSALAAAAEMPPSKAHRYLAGYITAGFAAQDPTTSRYMLGPLALEIGLAALRGLDVLALAEDVLVGLRDAVGDTVSMTVWANRGPTVVRWLEGAQTAVILATNLGVVLPVTTSANGMVFAALLPPEATRALVDTEIAAHNASRTEQRRRRVQFERSLAYVREHGLSVSDNLVQPAISSLAAPVRGFTGTIAASVAIVGLHGVLDLALDGKPAVALRAAAARISERLGAS